MNGKAKAVIVCGLVFMVLLDAAYTGLRLYSRWKYRNRISNQISKDIEEMALSLKPSHLAGDYVIAEDVGGSSAEIGKVALHLHEDETYELEAMPDGGDGRRPNVLHWTGSGHWSSLRRFGQQEAEGYALTLEGDPKCIEDPSRSRVDWGGKEFVIMGFSPPYRLRTQYRGPARNDVGYVLERVVASTQPATTLQTPQVSRIADKTPSNRGLPGV